MLYYYAHTGHKYGLDRAKRAAAVIDALAKEGIACQLLVNDFRAGVALKEHGIREHITIETILDIDAVAERGDSVIIDSDEDDKGKLELYVDDFAQVWRFAKDPDDHSRYGETVWHCDADQAEQSSVVVHSRYLEAPEEKEDRLLFFLGDSDHEKMILSHSDFFDAFKEKMELLLGHYFFVKYEEELAKHFKTLHEPEEYIDLIPTASTVVTASAQTAMEAIASGARTIFIETDKVRLYPTQVLEAYGVEILEEFDRQGLQRLLSGDVSQKTRKKPEPFGSASLIANLS